MLKQVWCKTFQDISDIVDWSLVGKLIPGSTHSVTLLFHLDAKSWDTVNDTS